MLSKSGKDRPVFLDKYVLNLYMAVDCGFGCSQSLRGTLRESDMLGDGLRV